MVVAGDPDVLPGPQPGAVLTDLVAWGGVPVRDLRRDGFGGRRRTEPAGRPAATRRAPRSRAGGPQRRRGRVRDRRGGRGAGASARWRLGAASVRPGGGGHARGLRAQPGHSRGGALAEALPGLRVVTLAEAACGPLPGAEAVVACFPGQAAGVLTRAMLVTAAMLPRRHLSVVTAAGDALPRRRGQGRAASSRHPIGRRPACFRNGALMGACTVHRCRGWWA